MNREEKKKLIEGYLEYYREKFIHGLTFSSDQYLDSLEMNKEKAIKEIQGILSDNLNARIIDEEEEQALKFAIDYMKSSQDEGETTIGYVNYYPTGTISQVYKMLSDAKFCKGIDGKTIPIRLPKK